MNKRILAVAVAGALAAPAAAFAQSSVTISGLFKGGFESSNLGNRSATRARWAHGPAKAEWWTTPRG
jgi:predicted porin